MEMDDEGPARPEKPAECQQCGALWSNSWSNAANAWVCLDCHSLAQLSQLPHELTDVSWWFLMEKPKPE